MSNGNQNIIEVIFRNIFGAGKSSALTSKKNEVILKLVKVHILEMEDVLFHLNSCVLMPENPKGKSSTDGNIESNDESSDITGIKALAVVFKQFEFDPDVKMIVTGHTDTSGTADFNFKLSDERAENILYLLTGMRKEWAEICYGRQKVEDYQQIMKYFEPKLNCGCDPGIIDDKYGENTKTATKNFFIQMNPMDADANFAKVNNDSKNRWPKESWGYVYDLYTKEMAEVLEISIAELNSRRVTDVSFIGDKNKYLGCGESFPIEEKEKNNYRSQRNRRVELLFFDQDEIPEINCPAVKSRVHTEDECPLWRKFYFTPLYIDPADLKAIVYHLQFIYYDAIKKKLTPVPDGLVIKAFGNDKKEIPSEAVYKDGVYFLKVKFGEKIKDPDRKEFYFQFETNAQWIFTENDKSDPVIKTMGNADVEKLPFIQRRNYYDLPSKWSSVNYWTRYDGDLKKGGRFQKIFTDELKLKPFGDNITKKDKPLVFSFDDIVLLDSAGGTQNIKDWDHNKAPKEKSLSEKSRVKIFVVDDASSVLKLHQRADDKKSARIPFLNETDKAGTNWANLFVEDPEKVNLAKIVFFRDGFYTIRNKRTAEENEWAKKNYVLGARAAVRNDTDYHVHYEMYYNDDEFGSTGDYDIHYFHNQHLNGKHPVSHIIIYVSISFMRDIRDPAVQGPIPTAADVKTYVDEGIYNAVDHWNRKQYYLEEDPKGDEKYIIRPFYFFDEREHFTITEPVGGFKINFDKRPAEGADNHSLFFNHANLAAAQNNSIGGISKFIAFVCKDVNGHWGPAYQWSIRSENSKNYSVFKLNKSGYKDFGDVFPGLPVTEHAESYGANTFAHELGHSTGQPDEYIKKGFQPDPGQSYSCYDFPQFYIPYSMPANTTSMMYSNGAPRLHHLYYLMHRIEEAAKEANKPLSKMLPNKKFTARLKKATMDLEYVRKINNGNPSVNKNPKQPLHSEELFQVTSNPLRRLKLELFDTGKDESSSGYFHKNQNITYQGVLVVRVMLSVRFTGAWANADKSVKIFDVEQMFSSLGEHFRLVNGTKDFKNLYIHFLPGFSNSWNTAGSNYNLDFVLTNKPGASVQIPNDAGTLTVYNDTTALQLVYYFMNSPGAISKNHITYLKTWVDGKLNDTFTLQDI